MIETIFFGSMIVGGVLGLYRKFSKKKKSFSAPYYAQTSEWYSKNRKINRTEW